MKWILMALLTFPVIVFMLYVIGDVINTAKRPIKVHRKRTSQPSYAYKDRQKYITIAK